MDRGGEERTGAGTKAQTKGGDARHQRVYVGSRSPRHESLALARSPVSHSHPESCVPSPSLSPPPCALSVPESLGRGTRDERVTVEGTTVWLRAYRVRGSGLQRGFKAVRKFHDRLCPPSRSSIS